MIKNRKQYIPLLDSYVENEKITDLENEKIRDAHVNFSFVSDNNNSQQTEEKSSSFMHEIIVDQSASNGSVPAQNITFLFIYSVLFAVVFSLIVSILLKTQRFINVDSTFPKRVYLNSFFLNNFTYENQTLNSDYEQISAFSNTGKVSIDEAVDINVNFDDNSNQAIFNKIVYVKDGIYNPLFQIYDNSIEFNQDYSRDLTIDSDVVVTGILTASSISFGPFKIDHGILLNTIDPTTSNSNIQLFSDDSVIDFLIKENYLIVIKESEIYVFYIKNKKVFNPILIFKKNFYNNDKIFNVSASFDNVFTFFIKNLDNGENLYSIKCIDKKCQKSDADIRNSYQFEIFDKFGSKIDLIEENKKCFLKSCFDENDCTKAPIESDSTGCGLAKIGLSDNGLPFVVIPEKGIVRIFDIDGEFRDEKLDLPIGVKYQPVPMSSFVVALNNGLLDVFSF